MKAFNTQIGSVRIIFDGKGKDGSSLLDIGLSNSGNVFICTDYGSYAYLTNEEFAGFIDKLQELKDRL